MGQQKPVAPGVTPLSSKRAQRLISEISTTAQQMADDLTSIGDLKVASTALAEMRQAFRMFSTYRTVRKVSAFGSARTQEDDPTFHVAECFARSIADAGFMVITGAGPGIMEACQRGAGRNKSFGINISLPFEQGANRVIEGDEKLISFRYFFTRKLFFIKEADAVVLFPGGFGTHDEGFEVLTLLQTGKCQPLPLVFLDKPRGTYWKTWNRYVEDHLLRQGLISREDLALYRVTDCIHTAVDEITRFYRVFHSARYVRDTLVLRVNYELNNSYVADLADEFADIVTEPGIEQRKPFSVERDEPDIWHLPRLALRFNRSNFGRLRRLIDRINEATSAPA